MIQWTAHDGRVRALGYSPDGAMLVSGGDDHSLRVWDPVSGERRADVGHAFPTIEDLAFSHDGRLLALATGRPVVVVCDHDCLRDGSLAGAITMNTWDPGVSSIAFSPDGQYLVERLLRPPLGVTGDPLGRHGVREGPTTTPARPAHRRLEHQGQ